MDGGKTSSAPDVAAIAAAAARLDGVVNATPLITSRDLDARLGGRVWLKAENLQRMGSFKIRGAYNALACLSEGERARGVVAWSSGNHAQGVALAAKLFEIDATIVMPKDTPAGKLAAVARLGATIVTYDRYTEDREQIARAIAEERGAPLVPSYDHHDVIAGQGTVGLEIVDALSRVDVVPDQVLVCCGGGGLAAGIATVVKARAPGAQLFGVEPALADDTARSFAAGHRLSNAPGARSICDALLTPQPGALTFPVNRRLLSDVLTVSEDEVRYAVGYARRELRLVVEPGGAVALAALLAGKLPTAGRATVATVSGGNIDDDMLAACVAHYDAQAG